MSNNFFNNNDQQDGYDNKKYHFVVIEDLQDTGEYLCEILSSHFPGSKVKWVLSGEEGLKYLDSLETVPDFLYLDRMLPGMNGDEVIRKLRMNPRYNDLAIMVVTAEASDTNEAVNLTMGADDYIRKPITRDKFLARLRNILRNYERSRVAPTPKGKDVLTYGDFVIDAPKVRATYKDICCSLTTTEFKLLYFLAQNEGTVFNRDTLLSKVWGYEYSGDNRTVDVTIARTRKKIKDVVKDRDAEYCISTKRGAGYSFEPSVFYAKK